MPVRFRSTGGGGGGPPPPSGDANFKAILKPALKLSTIVALLGATVKPAVAITNFVLRRVESQKPAIKLSTVASGAPRVLLNPALKLSNTLRAVTTVKPALALKSLLTRVELQKPALLITTRAVSGTARVTVNPAFLLTSTLRALTTVKPAIAIKNYLLTRVESVKPAIKLSSVITGTSNKESVKVGMNFLNKITGGPKDTDKPAMNLVQIKYDLTRTIGANAVSQGPIGNGRNDFVNINNALGFENGTWASVTGNAAGARGGDLFLDYADSAVDKSALTLISVVAHFRYRQTGTVGGNGSIRGDFSLDGGTNWRLIFGPATQNKDETVVYNLTTHPTEQVDTWAKLDALKLRARVSLALGAAGVVSEVDSVKLVITATATDAL